MVRDGRRWRRATAAAFELRQELGSLPASSSNWLVSRQSSTFTLLLFTQTCCSVRYAFINIYRGFYCSPVSSSLKGCLVRRTKQPVSEFLEELLQSELVTPLKAINILYTSNQGLSLHEGLFMLEARWRYNVTASGIVFSCNELKVWQETMYQKSFKRNPTLNHSHPPIHTSAPIFQH